MSESKKEELRKNGTFCVYPWIHLNTWPNGHVYQCCLTGYENYIGDMNVSTLEEIWNNDYMKDLRNRMMSGEKHKSCDKCYKQEEMGITSSRQNANKHFDHHLDNIIATTREDGHSEDFKLVFWDFRFSNICNFKCRMCGSGLSSMWAEEEQKTRGDVVEEKVIHVKNHTTPGVKIEDYLSQFVGDVEEVYFAGGEPLLMDEHYYVLQELIDKGNTKCRIRYNTNLSKLNYKKHDCMELWKHFDFVQIFASLDDFGQRAEYARKGTNWDIIEKNISKILESNSKVKLHTSSTINIWNILYLPEIIDRFIALGIPYYNIQVNNVLTFPEMYHINTLSDELKSVAKNNLNSHLKRMPLPERAYFSDKYESIKNFLKETPDNISESHKLFRRKTEHLDSIRNEKFEDVFPEMAEWYKKINE